MRKNLSVQGKICNYMQTGYNTANNSFAPQSALKAAVTFPIKYCFVNDLLNAIKSLVSEPFPFKYKSTRARA